MTDSLLLLRTWLLAATLPSEPNPNPLPALLQTMFTAAGGPGAFPNDDPNRVYAGHFPVGFDPNYGPGVVIRVGSGTTAGSGGGSSHPEIPLLSPRIQVTCYAGIQQYLIARQTYAAIYDWIQRRCNIDLGAAGYVLSCLEQVEGQDIEDPHLHYATNVSFWKLMLREN